MPFTKGHSEVLKSAFLTALCAKQHCILNKYFITKIAISGTYVSHVHHVHSAFFNARDLVGKPFCIHLKILQAFLKSREVAIPAVHCVKLGSHYVFLGVGVAVRLMHLWNLTYPCQEKWHLNMHKSNCHYTAITCS